MEKELYVTWERNPKHILYLIDKDETAYQVYLNGKFIDSWNIDDNGYYIWERNIIDRIRTDIYFQYKKYDTKILYYGHNFTDEEDFEPSTWVLAWEVASWIKPTLWTTLVTKHSSGLWTKFLIPRAIVDNNEIKIVRWLNYYYTKKKGE